MAQAVPTEPGPGPLARRAPARADAAAVLGLAALVALVFHSAVLGRGVFYYRDIALFGYPLFDAFVRCVRAGAWPLWNPYIAMGRPFLANPSAQVFYPPAWANLLLRPWTYYTVYVVSHFVFTAVGFYALARRLRLSRGASFVGAWAWIASGPLTSLVSFWQHLAGACWWPWALLAAAWALDSGRAWPALAWGMCIGAPILAGSPDMAVMGAAAAGAFALGEVRWRRPWWAANRRPLISTAIAAAFALAFSAAQWLPTAAAATETSRGGGLGPSFRSFWSIHPLSLLQLVLPAPLDDLPLRGEVRALLFEGREPMLPSLYLGLTTVSLAGAAFAARHPRRRFAGLLALAALVMALGRHTPVYEAVVTLLPPLRSLRYPAKAMALVAFAWSLLCAMGWDGWRARPESWTRRWTWLVVLPAAALAALAAAAALAGRFGAEEWGPVLLAPSGGQTLAASLAATTRHLGVAAVLAIAMLVLALGRPRTGGDGARAAALAGLLVVADLLAAHHDPSPLAPAEVFSARPALADRILGEPHSRVYSYDYLNPGLPLRQRPRAIRPETLALPRERWPHPWMQVLAAHERLYPSLLGLWGLEGSFDRDTLGLYPPYLNWLILGERAGEGTPTMLKALRMASVSHVVALHDDGFQDLVPVARESGLLMESVRLFRVPGTFPRAYAVGGARVGDGLEGLRVLSDTAFDPGREVILPAGAPVAPPAAFPAEVRVLAWRPGRVRLESRLEQPGYVVLADGYDPGWRARLDGQEVPVLRADIALRAVAVPAGTHRIEMDFRPPWLRAGLWVSALSVLAAAVAAVRGARRFPA